MTCLQSLLAAATIAATMAVPATAQISLTTAVDLALKNSPRVLAAQAEVDKARFVLNQTKDVYIPSFSLGSGLGYTYGFPFGAPSLFSVNAQSLIFDQSQKNYIHAARAGLEAANHSLNDVRQQVMEDAVSTYIALDADQERMKAAQEESGFASELTRIVQQRLDAGQDSKMELTRSKLTAANLRLRQIQLEDDASNQRDHLARLTGLPADGLATVHDSIPVLQLTGNAPVPDTQLPESVQAAYSAAHSKLQSAFGDMRKMYRPQIGLGMQYSRLASFNNYADYYKPGSFNNYNNIQLGMQFNLPIFDMTKRSKSRESMADAQHSIHLADQARDQFLEGRHKMGNAVRELQARAEVAQLERELALNQIDVVRVQLHGGSPNGQPATPKEEQNALIQERARYLDFLEADLQLRQTEINLMRFNGGLEDWLKSAARTQAPDALKPDAPQPQ
ncbi:TolC family protein [Edaphobacter flagellatus]|uniref:TolC family protein n=1 Tax=Edaphobacter flagellatus TaxID=1933044 RepID=UPI0021B418B5|nr:TolC family protein [Edaphobacter flagellatus]